MEIAICEKDAKYCAKLEKLVLDYAHRKKCNFLVDLYYNPEIMIKDL